MRTLITLCGLWAWMAVADTQAQPDPQCHCPSPGPLTFTNVTANSFTLHWATVPGALVYKIIFGSGSFDLFAPLTSQMFNNLISCTKYEVKVLAECTCDDSPVASGTCITLPDVRTMEAAERLATGEDLAFTLYPNPGRGAYTLHCTAPVTDKLYNNGGDRGAYTLHCTAPVACLALLQLYDAEGTRWMDRPLELAAGANRIDLDVPPALRGRLQLEVQSLGRYHTVQLHVD